jgi:hypothetical protein
MTKKEIINFIRNNNNDWGLWLSIWEIIRDTFDVNVVTCNNCWTPHAYKIDKISDFDCINCKERCNPVECPDLFC